MSHLGSRMLNTECEFVPHTQMEDTGGSNSESQERVSKNKKMKLSKETVKWQNEVKIFDINKESTPTAAVYKVFAGAENELQAFRAFFSESIVNDIINLTNIYAQQKNNSLGVTTDEMWDIFGGLLLSVYAKYSNKKLYWSTNTAAPTILSDAIRCRRCELTLRHIHLNDNSQLEASDRLYKLRPLLDHLQNQFVEMYQLEEHLSVDKSMIPYFGRNYAKQYIKGKPIRFGLKNWPLCSSSGYMYAFDMYTGKTDSNSQKSSSDLGFGCACEVVRTLLAKANVPGLAGYKIY